jgi:hypothetical protein
MTEVPKSKLNFVIGPDGNPLTIADLPEPGTKRWVTRRKAEVVAAVRGAPALARGSMRPLYADYRRIPFVAMLGRRARARRATQHAHPAIPPAMKA